MKFQLNPDRNLKTDVAVAVAFSVALLYSAGKIESNEEQKRLNNLDSRLWASLKLDTPHGTGLNSSPDGAPCDGKSPPPLAEKPPADGTGDVQEIQAATSDGQDTRFMKQPAPSTEQLMEMASEIRDELRAHGWRTSAGSPPVVPLAYKKMLHLIYTGNAESARHLLAFAYPEKEIVVSEPSTGLRHTVPKQEFWKTLLSTVGRGDYVAVMRQLNPGLV